MPAVGLIALILIIAFPLLELAILIKVGSSIGVLATLGIVIGTAALGLFVLRRQGQSVVRHAFQQARAGEPPVVPIIEGGLAALAGGLLIAPGLITDVMGCVLLIPPIRRLLAERIAARSNVVIMTGGGMRRGGAPAETIEGEFERIEERSVPPGPGIRD